MIAQSLLLILFMITAQSAFAQPRVIRRDGKAPNQSAPAFKAYGLLDKTTRSDLALPNSQRSAPTILPKAQSGNFGTALKGQDRGGGNAVGTELFDFAERAPVIKISKQTFYPEIEKVLNRLLKGVPQLAVDIKTTIADARWTLDPNKLDADGCVNASLSGLQRQVVACQNEIEIRLSKSWLTNTKVTVRSKAALIIHEAVRAQGAKDPFVTQITRDIFDYADGLIEDVELVQRLNSYTYKTKLVRPAYVTGGAYCETLASINEHVVGWATNDRIETSEIHKLVMASSDPQILRLGLCLGSPTVAQTESGDTSVQAISASSSEHIKELRNKYGCNRK